MRSLKQTEPPSSSTVDSLALAPDRDEAGTRSRPSLRVLSSPNSLATSNSPNESAGESASAFELTSRLQRAREYEVLLIAEEFRRHNSHGAAAYLILAHLKLGDEHRARRVVESLRPSDFHMMKGLRPPTKEFYFRSLKWILDHEISLPVSSRQYFPARRAQALAAIREAYAGSLDVVQLSEVRERMARLDPVQTQITREECDALYAEALLQFTRGRAIGSVFDLLMQQARRDATSSINVEAQGPEASLWRALSYRLYALTPREERAEWILYGGDGPRAIGLARVPQSGLILKDFLAPAARNPRVELVADPQAPQPDARAFGSYAYLLKSPQVPEALKRLLIDDLEFARRRRRLRRGVSA